MTQVRMYLAFRMRCDGDNTADPIAVPADPPTSLAYPHIPIAGDLLGLAGKLEKTATAGGATKQDLFNVAKSHVDSITNQPWKIDDVNNAIPAPSKWNPQTGKWDPVQPGEAFAWKLSPTGTGTGELELDKLKDTAGFSATAIFTPYISAQVG